MTSDAGVRVIDLDRPAIHDRPVNLIAEPTATTSASAPPRASTMHVERSANTTWTVLDVWRDRVLGADAPDWFALQSSDYAECVKRGHGRSIWRVELSGCVVFAKTSSPIGVFTRLKRRFRLDSARREWRAALRAAQRGVPVVKAVALGVRFGSAPRTVLLTEALGDAESLTMAWAGRSRKTPRIDRHGRATAIVDAVARLYGVAHNRGFAHRDGHPCNVLMRLDPKDGVFEARFVDLDRAVFRRGPIARGDAVRSLAQLEHYFRHDATCLQRFRFLVRYLQAQRKMGCAVGRMWQARPMVRAIVAAAREHALALARHRDRRLQRSGSYFSHLRLHGGWRACVVLRLARRRVLSTSADCDRSVDDWRTILGSVVDRQNGAGSGAGFTRLKEVDIEFVEPKGVLEQLIWSIVGSPQRRMFEHQHRLRHRDLPGEVVLAWAQQRRFGLVRRAILVRPRGG